MTDTAFEFACGWDNRHGGRKGKRRAHRVRLDRSRGHRSKHVTHEDEVVTAIRTTCCALCGGGFYGPNHYCSLCDWAMEEFGAIQCYSCNRSFDSSSTACSSCPASFKRHIRWSEEEAIRFIWDAVPLFEEAADVTPPWVW